MQKLKIGMLLFPDLKYFLLLLSLLFAVSLSAQKQPIDYVNNFIGSGSEGNTYPGAQAPFGMISVSPSNTFKDYDSELARSGYKYTQNEIRGFGLDHFSGVGCHAMQDFLFMPVTGDLRISPVNDKNAYKSGFTHEEEKCAPGWYQVKLKDYGIQARFASRKRSSIGVIDFDGSAKPSILFEPTNSANGISTGQLTIDAAHRRVSGSISTGGFCWRDPSYLPYTIYFVAEFDMPLAAHGVWKGSDKREGTDTVLGKDIAAFISFGAGSQPVHMRMALSFVSVQNALLNLKSEIPGWDLEKVKRETQADWSRYLDRIQVGGGTEDQKAIFYTTLYHNLLQPNVFEDVNGEYSGFDYKTHKIAPGHHKFVNFSLWDTYRTTSILQAILAPAEASDMAQSLLLDAQQGSAFPNWSMNNVEYGVMSGYSAFPFIANLYAFGARDFDLQGVKNMMQKVSMNYYGCQGRHGWLNLDDYKALGYVPVDKTDYGASMTEEYGIDDYSIAQICGAAGDREAEAYHLKRSQNVFHLYNPKSGYIQGRTSDGAFLSGVNDTTLKGYNEGNAIQYFWSVPQSMSKLIAVAGGKGAVEPRLDSFVSRIEDGWAPDKPYFWIGNEPCFGAMYVYNYLQSPWKAQYNVRRMLNDFYKNNVDGLPGDDDVGAMSALYTFCSIGLYPYIPGKGGFTISAPLFKKVTIQLQGHKQIVIQTADAGAGSPYIHGLVVNGKKESRLWLSWQELNKGAVLDFSVGATADPQWGVSAEDMPPSYSGK